MKRTICMLLAIALLAAFAGCAGHQRKSDSGESISLPAGPEEPALFSDVGDVRPIGSLPGGEDLALFPDAVSVLSTAIEKTDEPYAGGRFGSSYIRRVDTVQNADRSVIGYVIVAENRNAYNPPLKLAVGIRPDGTMAGIVFLELNETPRKGSKADDPAFRDQFIDRSVDSVLLNRNVDAISGATVTSGAVVDAVNAALAYYKTAIRP